MSSMMMATLGRAVPEATGGTASCGADWAAAAACSGVSASGSSKTTMGSMVMPSVAGRCDGDSRAFCPVSGRSLCEDSGLSHPEQRQSVTRRANTAETKAVRRARKGMGGRDSYFVLVRMYAASSLRSATFSRAGSWSGKMSRHSVACCTSCLAVRAAVAKPSNCSIRLRRRS